ncbi:hypothetical protein GH975_08535 [Litorivicinus lipolyticus]|uniref:Uncharacterized protein n=1 Tax=Litorivicinus lipolyticus TaxID=418701 RepID=A0A5Q2QBF1_9GAMM|nr:hypothetical protein [Litorivicinus lipolyticus]QGG80613.1 hypothetical protein GH975_08535 [Litorivicinus lipolyticus]
MQIRTLITLHTDKGKVPPQSVVALPDTEAKALIAKGFALATDASSNEDAPITESELHDAIAVLSEEGFGKDGKPLIKALEEVLDRDITQAERDIAWKSYQALQ